MTSDARIRRRTRWIAVLFMIGSSLFALGAVPWYSEAAGLSVTAATFFAGSIGFTAAAFLQYRESVDALPAGSVSPRRVLVWAPGDLQWLACAVQFVGTLWFNWSTGNAMRINLDAAAADERVWRPDALGSVAFLVASGLALVDAQRARRAGRPDSGWWIGIWNMAGSVAFGVSAVAAYVVPASGDVRNAELSNLGTFAGAVCFLVGAALLLPTGGSDDGTS